MTYGELRDKYEPLGFAFKMSYRPGGITCVHVWRKQKYGRLESDKSSLFEDAGKTCDECLKEESEEGVNN